MGFIKKYYDYSGDEAYRWAAEEVVAANCNKLLDIGCGPGSPHLLKHLKKHPDTFCGIEMHPKQIKEAQKKGIDVKSFDLNGAWPYDDNSFEVVHGTQVIEHVHNTRQFLKEILRILEPGGTVILTSENLTSFLNLAAMCLGYTPFSLQSTCGWYVGNPLGLHANEPTPSAEGALEEISSPHFSGITGHVRVLSALQAEQLMKKVGFTDVQVRSVGLMPLPKWMGLLFEKCMPRRGHWLMMKGRKPETSDS